MKKETGEVIELGTKGFQGIYVDFFPQVVNMR